MEVGFFTMDTVREVCSQSTLSAAKQVALNAIEKKARHAKADNVVKATKMVNSARSIVALGQGLTNFLLAHPSENLKLVK